MRGLVRSSGLGDVYNRQVEVGLGGRFDATNVLGPEVLAARGIAALGTDHERFLLVPAAGVPAQPLARLACA